jgi:hypothetical protein
MNPGNVKLDTPISQLMDRIESAAKWARSEEDKKLLRIVLEECTKLLVTEREHIEGAWRDGQSGVINQSGAQYYDKTYYKR